MHERPERNWCWNTKYSQHHLVIFQLQHLNHPVFVKVDVRSIFIIRLHLVQYNNTEFVPYPHTLSPLDASSLPGFSLGTATLDSPQRETGDPPKMSMAPSTYFVSYLSLSRFPKRRMCQCMCYVCPQSYPLVCSNVYAGEQSPKGFVDKWCLTLFHSTITLNVALLSCTSGYSMTWSAAYLIPQTFLWEQTPISLHHQCPM